MTQDGVAVWLGIDWGDEKHRWAMRIDGESRIYQGELEHTPEADEEFVSGLVVRSPGRQVAVALEQSPGALIFMLGEYAHLVLDWFSTPDTVVVGRLLLEWPTLEKLQRARAGTIAGFLREHRIPDSPVEALMEFIAQAGPAQPRHTGAAYKTGVVSAGKARAAIDAKIDQIKSIRGVVRLRDVEAALPSAIRAQPARFDAELKSPLSFGSESVTWKSLALLGSQPVAGSIVHARLLTPLNSMTSKQREKVEAVLEETLCSTDHRLVLQPGLIGGKRINQGSLIDSHPDFGPVTPSLQAGQLIQQSNLLASGFQISMGGMAATALYAGLAPNYIGPYQFNVTVPNAAAGSAVPVTFTLGGVNCTQSLNIAVSN